MEIVSFVFLCVILLKQCLLATSESKVEVSAPINPVESGGILAVQCQIWNMNDNYEVAIVRTIDGLSERISNGDSIVLSSLRHRIFLAIRTFPDGSLVYFLTLLNVSYLDHGNYGCMVSSLSGLEVNIIAKHSTDIDVNTFPDKAQPSCAGNSDSLVIHENSMLDLICTTYKIFPPVTLKWRKLSSYEFIPSVDRSEENNVFSTAFVTTGTDDNGAVFICEMTSTGFPDRVQTCQVGPITVIPKDAVNDGIDHITASSAPNKGDNSDVVQGGISSSVDDCSDSCQSSSNVVFHLTISTSTAGLLAFIFFITTLVMCCKYHSIYSETSRRQSCTTPSSVVDPVYVSLQRRRENERVYMTLEDPNNPEGKVLLPKEVFDEFYNRTLSLRKT